MRCVWPVGKGRDYSFEDLLNIARGQLELEDMLLARAKK